MSFYLGIEVKQRKEWIFISQKTCVEAILKEFEIDETNLVSTSIKCGIKFSKFDNTEKVNPIPFTRFVERLWFLTCIKPDILYGVGISSQFIKWQTRTHIKESKWILRYIKGHWTMASFILLQMISDYLDLIGIDWREDVDDRKTISGFAFSWALLYLLGVQRN